jgi:transposase InsO family protein
VRRVTLEHQPASRVARALSVSVRTVHKWVRRWRREGPDGLEDHSSRPHHSPRQLRRCQRRQILRLRRQRLSALQIARCTGLPVSTVVTVQHRLGLNRLARLTPPVPVIRYEWPAPGDLAAPGREEARPHRPGGAPDSRRPPDPGARIGWEYLHVAIDDATRLAYVELLADETGASVTGFLLRAAAWYAARGVRLRRVITDNGSGYVSLRFAAAVRQLGARHLRTRPYRPRTNGKAERLIQTLLREWAYARAYPASWVRRRALGPYLRFYNSQRPHTALGFRSPQQRWAALVNNVFVNDS